MSLPLPSLRRRTPFLLLLAVLLPALLPAQQPVPPSLYNGLSYRLIGPFRGGRSVAVTGIAGDGATFYFGSVDGGIWKTTNAGVTWTPLFDGQPVASIGALAIAPSNPKILYAGTGESDIRSNLASGNGVYRSSDGGATWTHLGLDDTRQISKIVVDSTNPNTVYAGALGHAYGPNPDRGVYKSTDGGATWTQVLFKGPDLGVADLAIAAAKPSTLFASLWNAHRPPWSVYGPLLGSGSGLYRSTDSGATWQPVTGNGLPTGQWGRSGVAVSPDGQTVYALIEAAKSGLYVSHDGGNTWALANSDPRLTSRAWYFSRITVDPSDPNTIYMPNVALMGSSDGGKTVSVVRGAPGGDDYHELWVDPSNGSRMILGTDQGTSISLDHGKTWSSWYNQPTAQLYHVTTDDRFPYLVYGAQQDSGAALVASRSDHQVITPRDWSPSGGSESGYIAVDPKDPDILYLSGAYGTVDRFDRRRALSQNVSPWPAPIFGSEISTRRYRDPWTPPLVFSPVDKSALYMGTQYVLKTTDGGLHWAEISPDLTGATVKAASNSGSITDPVSASHGNTVTSPVAAESTTPGNAIARGYGTLSTVAPSYIQADLIWAGSDTGILSLTRDGGKTWANVTPAGLAPWSRVSLIEPSHFNPAVAYASIERHRADDRTPLIYRTSDFGHSWQLIATGIPAPAFVNAVREDPAHPGLLFAGTEFGLYLSFSNGDLWQPLQLNLPVTSIRDLVIHGDDLVVATHGRSFWILDDITPLRQAAEYASASAPILYTPQATYRIDNDGFPGTPLPPEEPTAANPPSGALIDYVLPAGVHSVELKIYGAGHKVLRHYSSDSEPESDHSTAPIADRWFPPPPHLSAAPGMTRFIWNLAAGSAAETDSDDPDDGEGDIPHGPKVAPGHYDLELVVDGKSLPTVPLIVFKDPRSPATQEELDQQFTTASQYFAETIETRRALAEIASVQPALDHLLADASLSAALHTQAQSLHASIAATLSGDKSLGLTAANSALTAALSAVESSDRPAPAQVLELHSLVSPAATARVKQWQQLKSGPIAQLNQQLKAASHPAIAIDEIEEEVDTAITR